MSDKVIDFITHFQNLGTIDTFTNGCCYWFAVILMIRFQGTIMYNPVQNHFATLINGFLYDITGQLSKKGWEEWDEYKKLDELEAGRIYKYCIAKTED